MPTEETTSNVSRSISPYLKCIKKGYLKAMWYLPYQIFLLFPLNQEKENQGEVSDPRELDQFYQLLGNVSWCKSVYAKLVIKQAKSCFKGFRNEYITEKPPANFSNIQKTIKLLEQFLPPREMKELLSDLFNLAETTEELLTEKGFLDPAHKNDPVLPKLNDFFVKIPSPSKSLGDLFVELPFMLFVLVADADGQIDKDERFQFMRIIRDPEWCFSDCTQLIFTGTSYFYSEFYMQYNRGKFKKDIQQVERTIRFMEQVFSKPEADLIKVDLSRMSNEIAKASGGFGRIGAMCKEEKKVITKLVTIFGDLSNVQIPKNQ